MNRDGNNENIWQQSVPAFPQQGNIDTDIAYDVAVTGAGITRIARASLLNKAGKKVMIPEAAKLSFGTIGGTTPHLNNFLINFKSIR